MPFGRLTIRMSDSHRKRADLSAVPLFPLPNVVLFPRAVLPLHIFEERYKDMTADALAGPRQIAMALLCPGWEKNYHLRPQIAPVVCVGRILVHERNAADGTYNLLLQGHTRARIVREQTDKAYRTAHLEPLEEHNLDEIELLEYRHRMISVFDGGSLLATVIGRQFRQLLTTPLSTAEIADLIAFNFLEDAQLKHSLLCECDVKRRVGQIVSAFESQLPAQEPPAFAMQKPSLN